MVPSSGGGAVDRQTFGGRWSFEQRALELSQNPADSPAGLRAQRGVRRGQSR